MSTGRGVMDCSMVRGTFLRHVGLLALLGALVVLTVPDTSFARVFRVFGPENFIRSGSGPAAEVVQFQVQSPNESEFSLHVFYEGLKKDFEGIVPSAVVTLNGQTVVSPNDLNRNARYIKKPVTLLEENSLSVELHGKPGSGVRIVITGSNDEPQLFDYTKTVQPDGIGLLGPDLNYDWSIVDQPEGSNPTLSDPFSPSPSLIVDRTGEYNLILTISGAMWEESFPIKLTAGYPKYVPVPVETRVVFEWAAGYYAPDYGITVGPNYYLRPPSVSCGSPTNTGFQVMVLDRSDLSKMEYKTFNTPCGNQSMIDFLKSLSNTTTYPVAPLVIISSLNMTKASDVCGNSSACPLGHSLEGLGGTTIYSSNYNIADWINYSLIGIPGLGASNGWELNSWDHWGFYAPDPKEKADILGYFVQDTKGKWTFTYPDFVQIETRPQPQTNPTGNVITVGNTSYSSAPLVSGATGGFQVLVLDRDNLKLPNYPLTVPTNATFSTNATGSLGDQQQQAMYNHLNYLRQIQDSQRYAVIIASIATPISYKSAVFTNLIKLIGDYYGGTVGILNQLGAASPSITTYSLLGLIKSDYSAYETGTVDSIEESAPNRNLKVVMHKDRLGWYGPVNIYSGGDTAATSPDFSLLSVALQPPTPWPSPNPSNPEEVAAYQFISSHVGENTNDIRSFYYQSPIDPAMWLSYCLALDYSEITPTPNFSPEVFAAMQEQLCGQNGEFNYVSHITVFMNDTDTLLQGMQIATGNEMETVYNAVRSTVQATNESAKVKWDALYAVRGMLMVATAVVPSIKAKAVLGALNAAIFMGMHLSKGPGGADYTAVDTQFQYLKDQMNNLWKSGEAGKNIVLDMIMSDWGKLQYVGQKFMTDDANGGWKYDNTDKAAWNEIVTDSLESYYFQSFMPTVWKIDTVSNTSIPAARNFFYRTTYGYCDPYCGGSSANPTASWADSFSNGQHTWYVLENGIHQSTACGYVKFDSSASLRGVLFGSGDWTDGAGNPIGVNLNLSLPFFYERWLPSSVYTPPIMPSYGEVDGYNGTCQD